ncbi:hypothetical protein RYZ20_01000 [Thioclava sp. A2]|uniref:hypothetical protein n=1 Tax=Thioclava sp. FCG-A2 TaxID=3080562 RepID=UPI0029538534|nr:hypothetical protein [Thioclava sp. A2]MDV7269472.1 hypothetical protein [Thioclava sp. A2]
MPRTQIPNARQILAMPRDALPDLITTLRANRCLSPMMERLNDGLLSDDDDRRLRSSAALDRLGFLCDA